MIRGTIVMLPTRWMLLAACLLAGPALWGAERLPIFDAHVHYSASAWDAYPPDVVQRKLEAAGVLRALASSSPDDGTLRLVAADARRFVPVLRPYRAGVRPGNWTTDAATPDYLRGRLAQRPYAGLGELHLDTAEDARSPVMRAVARLAVERGLPLHVHAGAEVIEALFALEPEARILWGHAGFEPPETVRAVLERHPRLWAELSFQEGSILRGEGLEPAWAALLTGHPQRFLVGSDTYVSSRWEAYEELIADHRRYLALLPPAVARAIAYGNAVRLFGDGGVAFPAP
jgi:predicted TIM-barrel fold metal-dependent hydrolase